MYNIALFWVIILFCYVICTYNKTKHDILSILIFILTPFIFVLFIVLLYVSLN